MYDGEQHPPEGRSQTVKSDLVSVGQGEPRVAGSGLPVAAVVHACHEKTLKVALRELNVPWLDAGTIEPVLTYCAEQRCKADNATCPGCRLRTEKLGLRTFDEFVSSHAEITFEDSALYLSGTGTGWLKARSLEHLAKTWAGEEYWFWARRVLRKLRHGIRRAAQTGAPPPQGATPVLLLVRPQLVDNIGMVARAMANFGLEHLRLVAPRDGWPNEKARIAASGANFIIDGAEAFPGFEPALAGLNWVAATTARQRDLAKPVLTPEQAVAQMRRRLAEGQRCGIVFGPERNGLETGEVANADAIVMASVNPSFASLNLAQAVLLVGYEWMKQTGGGTLGRVTAYEAPIAPGLNTRGSPPAGRDELIAFFEHLESELDASGFFTAPDKRASVVQNLRSMFVRMGATEQEIRTLRGIVKALAHPKGLRGRVP
ncbi:MAG: RNA methyltransferase [Hyphomicrobiaceae bacterium]|nr:RNA methyltransferase [Hyphomicrobiaceae bacterium]